MNISLCPLFLSNSKDRVHRNISILLFCFIVIGFGIPFELSADDDLGTALLQYDFERDKIVKAARSKLIDLIGDEDYDSVQILISYCDSLTAPVKDWLSSRERFIIRYLLKDTAYLRTPSTYRECFGLRDTLPPIEGTDPFQGPYFPGYGNKWRYMYEHAEHVPDRLYGFLHSVIQEDVKGKLRLPSGSEDIQDFFQTFLFSSETIIAGPQGYKQRNELVRKYAKEHPDSPLKNVVIYNYYYDKEWTKSGFVGGGGGGYVRFDRDISQIITDRPDFHMFIDMTIKSLSYRFEAGLFSIEIQDTLNVEGITTPISWKANSYNINLSVGYKFFPHSRILVTPYTGFNIDGLTGKANSDSTLNDIHAPAALGAHVGTSVDLRIHDKPEKSMTSLGFRLDVGGAYSSYGRMRNDLGSFYAYARVGISFMMWGADRRYELD